MIMIRNKMNLRYTTAALAACLLCACRPEMPATSTITIDLTRPTVPVDRDLYGVTPEGEAEALGEAFVWPSWPLPLVNSIAAGKG